MIDTMTTAAERSVGSLCTGYGGLEMAMRLAGWRTRTLWHADNDPRAAAVLAHRHPDVPNLGDIRTADWTAVARPDIFAAGFPCTDLSPAGRRAGIQPGNRSGLWIHIAAIIDTLRPSLVVIENVEGILSATAHRGMGPTDAYVEAAGDHALRALGCVLGDLADLRYDAAWYGLPATDVGAPHKKRFRVFLLAVPQALGWAGVPLVAGRARPPAVSVAGELFPTVTAGVSERGHPSPEVAQQRLAAGRRANLEDAIALLPTPSARDGRRGAGWGEQPGRPLSEHILRLADQEDWGVYTPAITRWTALLGRPAPAPTIPGRLGKPRLSARFVEWMMGLPDGWVTDVPGMSNSDAIHVLGNGVIPQQGAAGLNAISRAAHQASTRTTATAGGTTT